jgi:nitrogen fixation protein FixH
MMTSIDLPARGRLTGRKVFLILACFFGTIAAADAFLIVSAVRSFSGADATSPYKAGQLYNGELARARIQEERHWLLSLAADRAPDGALDVTVNARDAAGNALTGRSLSAVLRRPTDQREDRAVALSEATAGFYRGSVTDIAPGQWDLVVDVVEDGQRVYRRQRRVLVR